MQHRFIGRKRELQLLQDLTKKRTSSLVVIRGRRRIGKSRLIQEFARKSQHYVFSGNPPDTVASAEEQREDFARQMQRQLGIALPRADDWGDLFWLLSQHTQKGRVVIVFDEISWMGSKDHLFQGKLKTAWDLYFKQNPELILILCGSISSWIEKNILSSTGFMGRVSLSILLEELSLSECNEFWNAEKERASSFDKFKILSVTGGVPAYLEEIVPQESAEKNIQRLCLEREGRLVNEFEHIFSDLFDSRAPMYKKIVERLAVGPAELQALYEALGVKKSGFVAQYLSDLVTSGFVAHDYTWNIKNGSSSKLSNYRLKDNYLRFYLKYIAPNKKKIEAGEMKLLSEWHSIMGLQFENLVLSNRKRIYEILRLDMSDIINSNPFFQRKTKDNQGCQIDYMIQDRFGTLYLCEIKLSVRAITPTVIEEVQQKIDKLTLPKHMSIRPVLIHVNGVQEEVIQSRFFSSIIDFSELLQNE